MNPNDLGANPPSSLLGNASRVPIEQVSGRKSRTRSFRQGVPIVAVHLLCPEIVKVLPKVFPFLEHREVNSDCSRSLQWD